MPHHQRGVASPTLQALAYLVVLHQLRIRGLATPVDPSCSPPRVVHQQNTPHRTELPLPSRKDGSQQSDPNRALHQPRLPVRLQQHSPTETIPPAPSRMDPRGIFPAISIHPTIPPGLPTPPLSQKPPSHTSQTPQNIQHSQSRHSHLTFHPAELSHPWLPRLGLLHSGDT